MRDDSGGWRTPGEGRGRGTKRRSADTDPQRKAGEGGAADFRLLTVAANDNISRGGLCGGASAVGASPAGRDGNCHPQPPEGVNEANALWLPAGLCSLSPNLLSDQQPHHHLGTCCKCNPWAASNPGTRAPRGPGVCFHAARLSCVSPDTPQQNHWKSLPRTEEQHANNKETGP